LLITQAHWSHQEMPRPFMRVLGICSGQRHSITLRFAVPSFPCHYSLRYLSFVQYWSVEFERCGSSRLLISTGTTSRPEKNGSSSSCGGISAYACHRIHRSTLISPTGSKGKELLVRLPQYCWHLPWHYPGIGFIIPSSLFYGLELKPSRLVIFDRPQSHHILVACYCTIEMAIVRSWLIKDSGDVHGLQV